eukprot:CAMPEP_0194111220 /NCGR_PEP_ID=MMETSP0150-20130528/10279_1 /TAXON_ID=122233 /ORGANISM="Chaetoceros debilis, Strain MM31A-1" /LENGTH=685 /DNA_ID=CAMNT_0038800601 /DNA_START=146 /DNA_END=2200 /DNA_ORIENTATION=+
MKTLPNPRGSERDLEFTSQGDEFSYAPEILTRSTELAQLLALDAGDVVECYALTRMAKLENSGMSGKTTLTVRKSAIGFRYKPKSSSPDAVTKEPFALTLEYGPQRTGSTQSFEAMPSVNGHKRELEKEGEEGMYLSWENHAKIYYGLQIEEEEWDNAYYMAPITGAVLSNIMHDYIFDYPILHPRYQPIRVVEKSTGALVLNSSNSDDFVWNVFQKLADMYVAVDPILAPKRYALHLHVDKVGRDVEKLEGTTHVVVGQNGEDGNEIKRNVANAAADFYYNLYSCVEAISTKDYSKYESTSAPSPPPTITTTTSPTSSPTLGQMNETDAVQEDEEETKAQTTDEDEDEEKNNKTESKWKKNKNNKEGQPEQQVEEDQLKKDEDGEKNGENEENDEKRHEEQQNDDNDEQDGSEKNQDREEDEGNKNADESKDRRALLESEQDMYGIVQDELDLHDAEIDAEIDAESAADKDVSQHVNDANNAADEAEKAAVVAKESAHSDEDHKAADAAGQAASAAKKAAQATSDAAADSAMESLLSGDGAMMTSIMSTCFSDPKYGIKKPFTEEGQVHEGSSDGTSNAFIYVDGLHYYRVNLTAPFMNIESLDHSIPLPNFLPEGKGDPIDIALATAIIGGFFFGIIVLLHHIRVLDWDMRLQFKWFFHPRQESLKRGGYSRSISTAEYPDDL